MSHQEGGAVGGYGRVFDMIVIKQPNANSTSLYNKRLNPAFQVVDQYFYLHRRRSRIASDVLITWNSDTEQARAIALAMPLLQKAERV